MGKFRKGQRLGFLIDTWKTIVERLDRSENEKSSHENGLVGAAVKSSRRAALRTQPTEAWPELGVGGWGGDRRSRGPIKMSLVG